MFSPQVGMELPIAQQVYRIAAHPVATWMPYGQEGRAAIVYQVVDRSGTKYALKVFKQRYRHPSLTLQARQLTPFASLKGLTVCRRQVLTPRKHGRLLKQYPDLLYALLMPWIEGPTWMEVLQTEGPLERATSLQLARDLGIILSDMESHSIAHCDLSGPNVLLPALAGGTGVELVDVEGLYGPELPAPEEIMGGSLGYAHAEARQGAWHAAADRFAGAILIAEMLGWSDERICQAAYGESYFAPDEMQQDTERYRRLQQVLHEQWGGEIGELFRRAWFSASLQDAPRFAEWRQALAFLHPKERGASSVEIGYASPRLAADPLVERAPEKLQEETEEWALWDLPPEETLGESEEEVSAWESRVISEAETEPAFEKAGGIASPAPPGPLHPLHPFSSGEDSSPPPFAAEEAFEEEQEGHAAPVKIIAPVALLSLLLLACAGILFASQKGLFTSDSHAAYPSSASEAHSGGFTSTPVLGSASTHSPTPLPVATEASFSPAPDTLSATSPNNTLWLAYLSGPPGDADIYVVPVDLSSGYPVADTNRRVAIATRSDCDEAEPSWSPDGQYLVFQANCDGNYDLWIVSRQGGEPVNLTHTPDQGEFEPAWWDRDKIFYRQGSPDGRVEEGAIHLLEGVTHQGSYENIVSTPMRGRAPEVSPEGDVIYMATVDGLWQVFRYDHRSGETSQLTTCRDRSCRWPMWSPRGDVIVYNLADAGLAPVGVAKMVLGEESEPETILSENGAGRPDWSASDWIAFNSDRGIEVVDENGQHRHLLISGDAWAPVWSH